MPEEMQTQIPEAKKRVTLKAFINQNDKLFTAIGVTGGLAALFTRLEHAELLSFITFIMLILLDFELWRTFPKSEEASFTLAIFEWLSQGFLFLVAVYLYMTYPLYFKGLVVVVVFLLFAGVFILLDRRFKLYAFFRRVFPEGKWYIAYARACIAGGIMGVAFLLAWFIANFMVDYLPYLFK
ncbi:hypothetical protein MUP01_13970 [Candidatus Bathyarchaeota archaeon]|nr:hypothetical protein [Candidatus Bathyarchaeota archaeon]